MTPTKSRQRRLLVARTPQKKRNSRPVRVREPFDPESKRAIDWSDWQYGAIRYMYNQGEGYVMPASEVPTFAHGGTINSLLSLQIFGLVKGGGLTLTKAGARGLERYEGRKIFREAPKHYQFPASMRSHRLFRDSDQQRAINLLKQAREAEKLRQMHIAAVEKRKPAPQQDIKPLAATA